MCVHECSRDNIRYKPAAQVYGRRSFFLYIFAFTPHTAGVGNNKHNIKTLVLYSYQYINVIPA